MYVIVDKDKNECHKTNCCDLKFANTKNIEKMSLSEATTNNYKKCKKCLGLEYEIKRVMPYINEMEEQYHIDVSFTEGDRFIYVKSSMGFWKIYLNYDLGKFQLFHLNEFSDTLTFEELKRGKFHRQSDVNINKPLRYIIQYIGEHDKAKVIIENDYRGLPRNTKRQRKYYRYAKKKEKQKAIKRVDELFALIEA